MDEKTFKLAMDILGQLKLIIGRLDALAEKHEIAVRAASARLGPRCWICGEDDHHGLPCPRSLPTCSVSVEDQQRVQH